MVVFKLSLIFIAALMLDGLILPAFFGLRESFLSLLVLIVPILYMGLTKHFIVYGLFFAFISESLRGLELGNLAIPFLFTAIVIYLAQRFLDIKYTYETRFGLEKSALVTLMSVAFMYVFSFFYRQGDVFDILTRLPDGQVFRYFDISSSLTIALEALMLVFVLNIVFNKKSDY